MVEVHGAIIALFGIAVSRFSDVDERATLVRPDGDDAPVCGVSAAAMIAYALLAAALLAFTPCRAAKPTWRRQPALGPSCEWPHPA